MRAGSGNCRTTFLRSDGLLLLFALIALLLLILSLGSGRPPVWTVALVVPPCTLLVRQIGRFHHESLRLLKLQEDYEGGLG